MENKNRLSENDKDFDTVKTFREIKDNISKDTWGLSYENFMKYLENSRCTKTQNVAGMFRN